MKRFTLSALAAGADGPVLADIVPGHLIERGGVSRYESGQRSHPEGPHVHSVPEVFCILQGSGVIEIDGESTPFQAGDILVVEPGEDHHLISDGTQPLVSNWLHMTPVTSDD